MTSLTKWNPYRGQRIGLHGKTKAYYREAFLKTLKSFFLMKPLLYSRQWIGKIVQGPQRPSWNKRSSLQHRFSTIQDFDKIIVLKEGKIIEQGNHAELIKKSGEYSKLYELSLKI